MRQSFISFSKLNPSFFLPITWFIISTILLTLPGTDFPSENWMDKIWFDKWVHIGMFTIMTSLWCWSVQKKIKSKARLKKIFFFLGMLWFAYGIGMEFVQKYFIPFRSFDSGDIIADGIGCTAGIIYSFVKYKKN